MKSTTLFSLLLLSASPVLAETPANPATTPAERPEAPKQQRFESFLPIAKAGEAKLVFLGDSITEGWEKKGAAVWDKYFAPYKAANFGIGGDRTEHVLWRMDHGNFDGIDPKLVVLMIGTNNTGHTGRDGYMCTADQTVTGVKAILDQLKVKAPNAKVLLLAIFPRGENAADEKRQTNESINAKIQTFADGERVFWMDINDKLLQPDGTLSREIMPDLLHPNEAGYVIWAEAIAPKVKELMQ
ncbi:MAG: GDSL family lipase [Verrucomicrobiales bacterium]|nr:GDSL family lipase [Verrucomicrobiales bacterium]